MDPRELFVHSMVINLDERTDRLERVVAELDAAGISVERFAAIPFRAIPPSAVDELSDDFKAVMLKKYPGYTIDNFRAKIACLRSHQELLSLAMRADLPQVAIFEDDVQVDHQHLWPYLERALPELPDDWELLTFGGETYRRPYPYAKHWVMPRAVFGRHGYVVRASAYRRLIDLFLTSDMAGDWRWWSFFIYGTSFQTRQSLMVQRYDWSDIDTRYKGAFRLGTRIHHTTRKPHPKRRPRDVQT